MTQQNFHTSYIQLLQAIEHCEKNNLVVPTLVMVYSAIDSVSWLASGDSKESGKAFKRWVTDWMLNDPKIKCTAEELYAARCGLVHTLTPTSSTTSKGVRKIAYSWGSGENDDLERLIKISASEETVTSVHLSDLIQAFRTGVADCLDQIYNDPERKRAFDKKCSEHFATIPHSKVSELLALSHSTQTD